MSSGGPGRIFRLHCAGRIRIKYHVFGDVYAFGSKQLNSYVIPRLKICCCKLSSAKYEKLKLKMSGSVQTSSEAGSMQEREV